MFEEAPLVIRSLVKTQFAEIFRFRLGPPFSSQTLAGLVVLLPSVTAVTCDGKSETGQLALTRLSKNPLGRIRHPSSVQGFDSQHPEGRAYFTRKILHRTGGIIVPAEL